MRLLLVEDHVPLADELLADLTRQGYALDWLADGRDAAYQGASEPYDLIILDVNLPELDGWTVLQRLRADASTRIMMLTAHGRLSDRVKGLDLGADDYMLKPFEFPELLARIRSLLRRNDQALQPNTLKVADLELDPGRHRAYRNGQRVDLTAKEFALLHLLMRQSGEVLSRTQIISLVWDMNFDCDTYVVEVSIRRLRAKIDDPFDDKLIHTLRGVGYVLEARE